MSKENKNMAKRKDDEVFQLPKSILNQLSECSAGGFLLFFPSQDGSIQPFMEFSNEIIARSLISYSLDFSKSFQRVSRDGLLDNISDSMDEGEDEHFDESIDEEDL